MSGGGKAFADDSLTGLHLGFGLNVFADEYKSDVDVLGIAKYASGGDTWTFTGPRFNGETVKNIYLTYQEPDYYWTGMPNYYVKKIDDITYTFAVGGELPSPYINIEYGGQIITKYVTYTDDKYTDGNFTVIHELGEGCRLSGIIPISSSDLPKTLIEDITSKSEGSSTNLIYGDKTAINISKTCDDAYLSASKPLKARTNRIGGELKMSYFHNLTDHFVLGVDVCGTLNQKAKKNIGIDKLNYVTPENTANSAYKISYDDTYAIYKDGKFTGTNVDSYNDDTVTGFFKTAEDENGVTYIPERTYTIKSVGESSVDTSQIIADNPGYTEISQPSDPSQYLQISNEKGGDVSFEKNKFNSRAAVVLGAQYKGWFAGVRGGVSYNQGKLHVKDSTGTSSEEVSFASPFVGVHLMKSVNMKGLENGHIYVTADVNVENKQKLNMRGIKNVKHNSVNVSLGMTWQIN